MSDEQKIKAIQSAFHTLRDELITLEKGIKARATDAVLYRLPLIVDKGHAHDALFEQRELPAPGEVDNEPVVPNALHGPPAIDAAAQTVTKLSRRKHQLPDRSFRTPGVVALPDLALLELAMRINGLKDDLKLQIKALAPARSGGRGHLVANLPIDDPHLRQIYRHIPVLSHSVERISFTWASNTTSVVRMTVAELRRWLAAMRPEDLLLMDTSWETALYGLEDQEVVARQRILQPIPCANVKGYVDETSYVHANKRITAVMPILHFGQQLPEIRPLKTLPGKAERDRTRREESPSRRKLEMDPLIAPLGIYRYKPMFRQFKST